MSKLTFLALVLVIGMANQFRPVQSLNLMADLARKLHIGNLLFPFFSYFHGNSVSCSVFIKCDFLFFASFSSSFLQLHT
jgi:hypothetical protein